GARAAMPLIPRRLLFADPDRSSVRISPDGTRLAFLAPVDGVLNLWVSPIKDVKRARPFTRVTDRALGPWLAWLPNNRHVVFFRVEMVDAMTTRAIACSDDGKEIYWLDARGRDKAAVVAQDMATGTMRMLAEDAQADCVELVLDPVSHRPVAAAAVFAHKRWQ